MKIAIFSQKESFNEELQRRLSSLGDVSYIAERKEYPEEELLKFASGADIIGGVLIHLADLKKARRV